MPNFKIVYVTTRLALALVFVPLFMFPNSNFAQGPNLGATSGFALFTAAGAFDNSGATSVTGDIGTNAGAFTGFPPGVLTGEVHVIDSVSAQAAIDVDIAYNFLFATTCDSVIGVILGNNQVLTPKVYCIGAASVLTGDLILDGQGNSHAIFIFKIDGAFSADVSSHIILIDSASSLNIFWQINGAFELGDSSVLQGIVITNGAINLLESSSLLGKGLSRQGAISLHNNIVGIENQNTGSLPIELLEFTAIPKQGGIQLDWSTASETNNNYFTIERSENGISFAEVKRINGAKNSTAVLHYRTFDKNDYEGILYYRLKQTDFNGKSNYFFIVAVSREKPIDLAIYPNPFMSSITISVNNNFSLDNYRFKIYNTFGKEVLNEILAKQTTVIETSHLSAGIYFYSVVKENKIIQHGRLISQ